LKRPVDAIDISKPLRANSTTLPSRERPAGLCRGAPRAPARGAARGAVAGAAGAGARRLVRVAARLRARLCRARLGGRSRMGCAQLPGLLPLRRARDGAAPRGP